MGLAHGNAKDTFLPVTKLGLLENCKTEMISEEKYFVILVCKVYNVAQQYLKPFCLPLNMSELKTQTLCCIVVKRDSCSVFVFTRATIASGAECF